MPDPLLVCGFGPFLDIEDNPAARLARAVDGARLSDGGAVVGRVMPVSYARAVEQTLVWTAELSPRAVVGIGVARGRSRVCVETVGSSEADGLYPDVDGARPRRLRPDGPPLAHLSAPAEALAEALGALVSADAGRYVCNGWIYGVALALAGRLPTTFLHIPPDGLAPQVLCSALDRIWGGSQGISDELEPK